MMVRAKNYETMSTFVKVMQKKLWPLFFRIRCIIIMFRTLSPSPFTDILLLLSFMLFL